MNDDAKKISTAAAAAFGRLGGQSKSKRKRDAARKTLAIARKSRWTGRRKKTA